MKKMYLDEIKRTLGIETKSDNCIITCVTDNIKHIGENTLVFHVQKADRLNKRKFRKLSTCYIVTDQPLLTTTPKKDRYLFVQNVHAAYMAFVSYYRNLFHIPVVAVTGTCGKTSTKEMISQILKNQNRVVHTISSKNGLHHHNDYLMSIDETTEYGVFETAITHPGHLILDCEFFQPTIGIITTIGIDHLNWCKTLDNYIRTKGEMLTGLRNKGILIINNDDENIKKIDMSQYQGKIVTFGIRNPSEFFADNINYDEGGMKFTLIYGGKNYQVFVPGYGEHNVYNALAALAALTYLGKNICDSIYYLKYYKPIEAHNEFHKGINGSTIIDDTWSSNPTSMKAALKVLHDKGQDKIRVAVLGKISYLGSYENEYYEQIAKMLLKYKTDVLITQDSHAKNIGMYAIRNGMDPKKVIYCQNIDELTEVLKRVLNENTMVLFKCSMLDKSNQKLLRNIIVQ